MQESYFLNQEVADQEVIKSLLHSISTLTSKYNKLMRRNYKMQLLKNNEGNIVAVIETEEITREDLVSRIEVSRQSLADAENNLVDYDALINGVQSPVAPTEPEQPAEVPIPVPEQPQAEVVIEQPQPETPEVAPVDTVPQPEPIVLQ